MIIENELKELLIRPSKSVQNFPNEIDITTTIQSMLNCIIEHTGVKKAMKCWDFLGIVTNTFTNGYNEEKQSDMSGITYNKLNHIIMNYRTSEIQCKENIKFILEKEFEYTQRGNKIKIKQTHEDVLIESPRITPVISALTYDKVKRYKYRRDRNLYNSW